MKRASWTARKKECPKCHQLIGSTAFNKHVKVCEGFGLRNKKSESPKLANGKTQAWLDAMTKRKGHAGKNQYTKAIETGVPYILSQESRNKISEAVKTRTPEFNKKIGEKISKTCLKKSFEGEWHTSLAKRMHYEYKGEDYHGKWEYAFAIYSDRKQLGWKRNKNRFAYEFEGKTRFYTPDFVRDNDYIEIKGYETEKDRAKWGQFPLKLDVLKEQELRELLKEFDDLLKMI